MDIKDMTFDDLLVWLNSLGICRFEDVGHGEARCRSSEVEMRVSLGTFDESIGGGCYIGFDFEDKRDGFRGGGCPCRTLDEAERKIEARAKDIGLYDGQLTLF